jgi:mRNA interferase MazF
MPIQRGDVVLVDYPFTGGQGSKLRPALVVQWDVNNQRLSHVILAAITTTTHRQDQPTQYLVDTSTADGKAAGLRFDSVVTCEKLMTVDQQLCRRKLGALPVTAMERVDECLKAALDLQ